MLPKLIQYFIKHSIITNWVMIVICIAGIFALFSLERRINPKMEIDEIEVDIPYPGASAVEVEEGIIIKIEESLRGIEGIEKVYSNSQDNYGWLSVEIIP